MNPEQFLEQCLKLSEYSISLSLSELIKKSIEYEKNHSDLYGRLERDFARLLNHLGMEHLKKINNKELDFSSIFLSDIIQIMLNKAFAYSNDSECGWWNGPDKKDPPTKRNYSYREFFSNTDAQLPSNVKRFILNIDKVEKEELHREKLQNELKNYKKTKYLRNQKYFENLSKYVGHMDNLEIISIYDSNLNVFPAEIGKFKKLESISLSNNQIKNIPKEIGELPNLKELNLYNNNILRIPRDIGKLNNLNELQLGSNYLKELPKEIGDLINLNKLCIYNNAIKEFPLDICRLAFLEHLDLHNNQITKLPKKIEDMLLLKHLDLSNNNLKELPKEITQLSELEYLNISGNHIKEIPEELYKMTKLRIIRDEVISKVGMNGFENIVSNPIANQYKKVFSNSHVILPVIHVETETQAIRNAKMAFKEGCDGIFLINHGKPYSLLLEIHSTVVKEFPDWWVGVNCLGVKPENVFSNINNSVKGVWVDNAKINEKRKIQTDAIKIQLNQNNSGWKGLYFGGVAFKYQRKVNDYKNAAKIASKYMDVVTTSGPGIGEPASIAKITAMKESLQDKPLAIASGITPENIKEYLDIADCFLVATGISKSFTEFNPYLLKALVDTVRSYDSKSVFSSFFSKIFK